MGNNSVLLFSQSNQIPQCFCSFWGPKAHLQYTVHRRTAGGNLWLNSQTKGTIGVTVVIWITEDPWLAEDDAALMAEYCCPTPSFNTRGKGNETVFTYTLVPLCSAYIGKHSTCGPTIHSTTFPDFNLWVEIEWWGECMHAGAADFSQHDIWYESTEDLDACLGSCVRMFFPYFLGTWLFICYSW